jgi:hypothetical protein
MILGSATTVILLALLIAVGSAISLAALVMAASTRQDVLHLAHEINSRMDQLLDERGRSERAAGRAEGPDQQAPAK